LTRTLAQAASDLALPPPAPFDPPALAERKREEFAMADFILVLSEVHRQSFMQSGFPSARLHQIPLWVDSRLWHLPGANRDDGENNPLRVLFVGSLGLRKGIPYLVRAIDACGADVELTIAGVSEPGANRLLAQCRTRITVLGGKTKTELRRIYWDSDILVLPSLVDTFGFVALEAMACGLPVIVTANCGVPVPEESWRVPIMDSNAIAIRLMRYAKDRTLLRNDGTRAAIFAQQYTPERYREAVKHLLLQLL